MSAETKSAVSSSSASEQGSDLSRIEAFGWVLLFTALGLGLRLFRLDHLPPWNDEALQLIGIRFPVGELRERHLFGVDHMPALSYMIQRLSWLMNPTLYGARLPGAIFGTLMIPVAYLTGRKMCDRLTGVMVSLMTATSFFLVYYSQECRAYIFFATVAWVFMYCWVGIIVKPLSERVPIWRWPCLIALGALAGWCHYSAIVFLPVIGGVSTLALVVQARSSALKSDDAWKRAALRWVLYLVTLGIACGCCYLIMKYYMGPKFDSATNEAKGRITFPSLSYLRGFLGAFLFGGGWRWLAFIGLVPWAWFAAKRQGRSLAWVALAVFVMTILMGFYIFPLVGFRSAGSASSRYLCWSAWSATVLMGLGAAGLVSYTRRGAARFPGMLGVFALIVAVNTPAYCIYYTMPAKRYDLNAFKVAGESITPDRTLVLCNSYDMHYLQSAWPSNCTYASLPGYGSDAQYAGLNLDNWLKGVVDSYPDVAVMSSHYAHSQAQRSLSDLRQTFHSSLVINDSASRRNLYDLGLLPFGPLRPMEILYNSEQDLEFMAQNEGLPLPLMGNMPLVVTRGRDGHYTPWRGVFQPVSLRVFSPDSTAASYELRLSAAKLAKGASLALKASDGKQYRASIPTGTAVILHPQQRQWVNHGLQAQEVVQLSARIPMELPSQSLAMELSVPPGWSEIELVPLGAPIMLGQASIQKR